ncbi:hypothetical protein JCM10908_006824 [Rhodotorula pacifica]|uniref:uncharacterized protein n=1 Tax=Rhodotorula pacifica TaxID=1495444 RepID=UPI00317ED65D
MTRGYFGSAGIDGAVRTVRLHRTAERPNRIAALDMASLAPKYWGADDRMEANIIMTNIRRLQVFFPRVVLAPDGPLKPGKEDRTTSPPRKQQHLSGEFDLASSAYMGMQLATFELLEQRAVLEGSAGMADVEAVMTGGEGEAGAWLAYEAEKHTHNARDGRLGTRTSSEEGGHQLPAAPLNQGRIFADEKPLTPDEARAFVASSSVEPPRYPIRDALPDSGDANCPKIFLIMRDGDFLHGSAEEIIQDWRVSENQSTIELEIVDANEAITLAGKAVKSSFQGWFHRVRSKAEQSSNETALPAFSSALLAFDEASATDEVYVDVAMAVEALFGDFGPRTSGYRTGQITVARLGVLVYGDLEKWRKLIAERAEWAHDATAFFRGILRHFVQPGAADPSLVFSESLNAQNASTLPYKLWYSRKPHALRLLARVVEAMGLPPVDFATGTEDCVQDCLWNLFSTHLALVPASGWRIFSTAFDRNAAAPTPSVSTRSTTSSLPIPPTSSFASASMFSDLTADSPSPALFPPDHSPSAVAIAGSGHPGSPRGFPLLGSNMRPQHWEALGVSDEWRHRQGAYAPLRAMYAANETMKEQEEKAIARKEDEEVAAEVEEEFESGLEQDTTTGLVLPFAEASMDRLLLAVQGGRERTRAKRESVWLQLVIAFVEMAQEAIPSLAVPGAFSFKPINGQPYARALYSGGSQICEIRKLETVELASDNLRALSLDQQRLFREGCFSTKGVRQLTEDDDTLNALRPVLVSAARFLGIPILSERMQRFSILLETGFNIFLKPSVLTFLLQLPSRNAAGRVSAAEAEAIPTWYGFRLFIDFCIQAKSEGIFDVDSELVDDIEKKKKFASALQTWFGKRGGAEGAGFSANKPRIVGLLHALGVAPTKEMRELMVPPSAHDKKALEWFRNLPDHEWIVAANLMAANPSIAGNRSTVRHTMKDMLETLLTMALKEATGGNVALEDLDDDARRNILGGEVMWTLYTLRYGGVSGPAERPWWRKIGGLAGDPLEKEIARHAAERAAAIRDLLEYFRNLPDHYWLRHEDMTPHISKVAPGHWRDTSGGIKGFADALVAAVLEGTDIDPTDEDRVKAYIGGEYRLEQGGCATYKSLRWYSADPLNHPPINQPRSKVNMGHETYAPGERKSARLKDKK